MGREKDPKPEQEPVDESLNKWLMANEIPAADAQLAAKRITHFCSKRIGHILDFSTKVGVTTWKDKYGTPHVDLSLLWPTPFSLDSLEQTSQVNKLTGPFSKEVSLPSRPQLSVHFAVISPDDIVPSAFEDKLRESCEEDQATYLGVFG